MKFICILLTLLINHTTHADVLSTEAENAHVRAKNHPDVFDRTDQYCTGLKIKSKCVIPGNAFEGGGEGECWKVINEKEGFIDLYCQPLLTLDLDRQIPEGPYLADKYRCNDPDRPQLKCEQPKLVFDKYCENKIERQSCTVNGKLRVIHQPSKDVAYAGTCRVITEKIEGYFQGKLTITRPIMRCEPLNPRKPSEFKVLGILEKLKQ